MAGELQGIGACSYNGFSFPANTATTAFKVTPVEDRAKRTHSHYLVSLTLRTHLTGRPADRAVADAIRRLTQPAGALVYRGKGFGTFNINVPGGSPDILWGPKPRVLDMETKGGAGTVKLTWQVEFATMTCLDAIFLPTQPMEFSFTVQYDIDYAGLTKRTYRAFLRLPSLRRFAGDRQISVTADEFREKVTPALAPEFRRTVPASVTVSEDKCGLDFSCQDDEVPNNNYPPGVVHAEASHTIASEPGKLFTWTGTLRARFELAKGTPVSVARDFFLDRMLTDRIDAFRKNPEVFIQGAGVAIAAGIKAVGDEANVSITEKANRAGFGGIAGWALASPGPKMANVTGPALIPWAYSFSEPEIFGRSVFECTAQYRIVAASKDLILLAGGLWTPVKGTNWKLWSASVAVHQGPRGYMRMVLNPGDDSIKDLCRNEGFAAGLGGGGNFNAANLGAAPVAAPAPGALPGRPPLGTVNLGTGNKDPFPPLEPGRSWLDYNATVRIEQDSGVTIGTTLPSKALPAVRSGPRGGTLETNIGSYGTTFAQRRTVPRTYIILSGYGMRAGYPIPKPELTSVNGVTPVECSRSDAGEGFEETVQGQAGVNIHYGRWRLRYCLVGVPPAGGVPTAENPVFTER